MLVATHEKYWKKSAIVAMERSWVRPTAVILLMAGQVAMRGAML